MSIWNRASSMCKLQKRNIPMIGKMGIGQDIAVFSGFHAQLFLSPRFGSTRLC